uniref:DB domain-containing protein n=1 Tax=Syphacia muris TaxID=451379 RepID=A0A0N5AQP4_9BILA
MVENFTLILVSIFVTFGNVDCFDAMSCYKDPTTETCRQLLAALIRNSVLNIHESAVAEKEEQNIKAEKSPLIVVDNPFPARLTLFCQISSVLQRDRLCYGSMDEYYLACPNGAPPIHLVPFCLGYQMMCSQLSYIRKSSCKKNFPKYKEFCTTVDRISCDQSKNCSGYDYSCYCEPYALLQKRFGIDTAAWCQRFELFCNAEKRTEKSTEMVRLLKKTVGVHKQCMNYLNVAKTICVPFRPDFDYERCIKFIFDCELISEFDDEVEKSFGEGKKVYGEP